MLPRPARRITRHSPANLACRALVIDVGSPGCWFPGWRRRRERAHRLPGHVRQQPPQPGQVHWGARQVAVARLMGGAKDDELQGGGGQAGKAPSPASDARCSITRTASLAFSSASSSRWALASSSAMAPYMNRASSSWPRTHCRCPSTRARTAASGRSSASTRLATLWSCFLTSAPGCGVRKRSAERLGRHPARPEAVAAVMRGAQGPCGQAGECEGCTGGVRGLCGRRLVAVIGILPTGAPGPGAQRRGGRTVCNEWEKHGIRS